MCTGMSMTIVRVLLGSHVDNFSHKRQEMEFIAKLSRQPLFELIGAIIVLLFTDMRPVYGVAAFVVWIVWIWFGKRNVSGVVV